MKSFLFKSVTALAALSFVSFAHAGFITIQDTGLLDTDKVESFDVGATGNNVSDQFIDNGITIATIDGRGVSLVSNTMLDGTKCNNTDRGVSGQYLWAGTDANTCTYSTLTDSFSLFFDQSVTELSWNGFSRAINGGFTITAFLDDTMVSTLTLERKDEKDKFNDRYVVFTGGIFNEISVIENGTSNRSFAIDNLAWNVLPAPVSEPSTLAVFLLAALGLFVRSMKKN